MEYPSAPIGRQWYRLRWYYYGKLLFYYHERTSFSRLGVNYG
jgi:hypothetical protein